MPGPGGERDLRAPPGRRQPGPGAGCGRQPAEQQLLVPLRHPAPPGTREPPCWRTPPCWATCACRSMCCARPAPCRRWVPGIPCWWSAQVGAYNLSQSTQFIHGRPAVVLVDSRRGGARGARGGEAPRPWRHPGPAARPPEAERRIRCPAPLPPGGAADRREHVPPPGMAAHARPLSGPAGHGRRRDPVHSRRRSGLLLPGWPWRWSPQPPGPGPGRWPWWRWLAGGLADPRSPVWPAGLLRRLRPVEWPWPWRPTCLLGPAVFLTALCAGPVGPGAAGVLAAAAGPAGPARAGPALRARGLLLGLAAAPVLGLRRSAPHMASTTGWCRGWRS
jgi:hypothetical protein